jgi:hypothetical protein
VWWKSEYSLAYKIFEQVKYLVRLYRSNSLKDLFGEKRAVEIRKTLSVIQDLLDELWKMEKERDSNL